MAAASIILRAVSYTHLDVYKRQAPLRPLGIIKQRLYRLALVRIAALQAMLAVGGQRIEDRVAQGARDDFFIDCCQAGIARRVVAVESVRQPIRRAIEKQRYRGDCLLYTSRCV